MNGMSLEEIRGMAERGETDSAAEQLARVEIIHLTKNELEAVEEIIGLLPVEVVTGSMELTYRMILLQIQKADFQKAEKWYSTLVAMRGSFREGSAERKVLENRITCAAFDLPQDQASNLLLSLAVASHDSSGAKFPLAKLSATNKFPSVLRGTKDLSFLGMHYRASASIVRPLLATLLEDDGKGVCEAGVAEVLYEQGDLNGAALEVAAAISAENPEIAFAGLAILARIGAVDTTARPPSEILAHIGVVIEEKDAGYLIPNYKALEARFAILRGDTDAIRAWMEQCTAGDLDGCAPRDHYELMTKAKAYISLGEYSAAATLLESLKLSLERHKRPADIIECLIGCAIVCDMLGSEDIALQKLEQALLSAQDYAYIRIFADHGRPVFHLMVKYIKKAPVHEKLNDKYLKRIIEASKIFSSLYPALFNSGSAKDETAELVEELTQSELHILQLLEQGKSNSDIAKELSIKTTTVKFHVSNIFEKLGVSNRVEAINNARNRGILA